MATFKELEQQAANGFTNINLEALEEGKRSIYSKWFSTPTIVASCRMDDFARAADYGLAAVNRYALPDYVSPAHAVAYFQSMINEDFKRYRAIQAPDDGDTTADTQEDENAQENGAQGAENGDN